MANPKKKKSKKQLPEYRPNVELEDRRAVALTVAWMLATTSGTVAAISWVIAWFITWSLKPADAPSPLVRIPNSLWFIALMTGILSMVLLPAVYRWRQVPPPRSIAIFSVAVALVPIVGPFLLWLLVALKG